jgi:hypothetical protein
MAFIPMERVSTSCDRRVSAQTVTMCSTSQIIFLFFMELHSVSLYFPFFFACYILQLRRIDSIEIKLVKNLMLCNFPSVTGVIYYLCTSI